MSYPLSFSIFGRILLEHSPMGSFTSGTQLIEPGQTIPLTISVGLNYTEALESNATLLQKILFNQTNMFVNYTISASIIPLLSLNLTSSASQNIGPVLQNLNVQIVSSEARLSANQSMILVPLIASWTNKTPLTFDGTLSAVLTSMPNQQSPGNYGSASGAVALIPDAENSANMTLGIPTSYLLSGTSLPSGSYEFQFTLDAYGTSVVFNQSVSI